MAADYNEAKGLDVRLTWPEDTGGDGAVGATASDRSELATSAAGASEARRDPHGEAGTSLTANTSDALLPVIDARLGELIARVGRLEAASQPAGTLESRLAELIDRVAGLEQVVEDRLGHLDDRLEYLAGAGLLPTPADGGEGQLASQLVQVADHLDSLTKEMVALRRRITLRGRSEPASGQPSTEEMAAAVADLVVAALAGRSKSQQVSAASGLNGPEAPEGRRLRR